MTAWPDGTRIHIGYDPAVPSEYQYVATSFSGESAHGATQQEAINRFNQKQQRRQCAACGPLATNDPPLLAAQLAAHDCGCHWPGNHWRPEDEPERQRRIAIQLQAVNALAVRKPHQTFLNVVPAPCGFLPKGGWTAEHERDIHRATCLHCIAVGDTVFRKKES